jgi:lactose/L-arabinose transport system substrate-binding protein
MPARASEGSGSWRGPLMSRRRVLGAGLGLAAGALVGASGPGSAWASIGGARRLADTTAPKNFVFSTWGSVGFYEDGYQAMQKVVPQYAHTPFVSHEAASPTAVREDIITGFAARNYSSLPAVCEVTWSDIAYLASYGTLLDLTDLFKPYVSQISPAVLDIVTVDGKIIACPWRPNTCLFWYNDKVLTEVGIDGASLTTYAAYMDAGMKVAAHKFADGKPHYLNSTDPSPAFNTWFLTQQGEVLFNKEGNLLDFRQDSRFKAAMQLQVDLAQPKLSMSVGEYTASWYQALADDLIATIIVPNWMDQNLREDVTSGKGDWRVAELPAFSAGGGRKALNGAAVVVALNTPGADLDLAWSFMQKSFYDQAISPGVYTTWYLEPCWYPVEDKVGYHTSLPYYGGEDPGAVDVAVQRGAIQEVGSQYYAQATTILSTALAKAIGGLSVDKAISYAWDTMAQQKIPAA